MAEALRESESAERAAVVVYGVMAGLIELLLATASRYAAAHPELLKEGAPPPPRADRARGGIRFTLYGVLLAGRTCCCSRGSPRSATSPSPPTRCSRRAERAA